MWSLKQRVCLSLAVFFSAVTGGSAAAGPPSKALDAYVQSYTQMGKAAALIFNHDKTRTDAQAQALTTWVDAQCKILSAKAAWITAVATANSTDAKTLQTLQQVRSLALDNNLKVANTFYEKRKLHEAYQGLNTHKRPTREDVIRYSKVSAPQRPANFQLDPVRGKIQWPGVLLSEEFSDGRIRLDCLFAQRKAAASMAGNNVSHQMQTVAAQMREQLQSKVRRMTPAEYLAARRFLERLAYEARFPARIEGVASR
jgi:hypothetical protein